MTINNRIKVLGVALLITLVGVIQVVMGFVARPNLMDNSVAQLESSISNSANELQKDLRSAEATTRAIAALAQSYLDSELNLDSIGSVLDDFGNEAIVGGGIWPEPYKLDSNRERASVFWARNSSQTFDVLDDFNDPSGSGYHNEDWYTVGKGLSTGECAWSSAYLDTVSNRTMVSCTVRIDKNGSFWGVATTDIVLANIDKILKKQNQITGGYTFVVDSSDQIISFPSIRNKNLNLVNLKDLASKEPSLAEIRQGVKSSDNVYELSDEVLGSEDSIMVTQSMPEQNWKIGIVLAQSIALDSLHTVENGLNFTLIPLVILFVVITYLFGKQLVAAIETTTDSIDRLRHDSSQQNIDIQREDEIGELQQAVNNYGDYLRSILRDVANEAEMVKDNSSNLLNLSAQLNNRAQAQTQENAQLAAAIHEMSASADDVSSTTKDAADTAEESVGSVNSGQESVGLVNDTIDHLAEALKSANEIIQSLANDSNQVGNVLSVIKNISEQTNLLALNAAIEAARAGEQGRGFAVVADEVRSLAMKTQESASEIEEMINQLQQGAGSSVKVIEDCYQLSEEAVGNIHVVKERFSSIHEAFFDIKDKTQLIADSSSEQARVTDEISKLAIRIKDISDLNAVDAEKLKNVSEESNQQAERLHEISNH